MNTPKVPTDQVGLLVQAALSGAVESVAKLDACELASDDCGALGLEASDVCMGSGAPELPHNCTCPVHREAYEASYGDAEPSAGEGK